MEEDAEEKDDEEEREEKNGGKKRKSNGKKCRLETGRDGNQGGKKLGERKKEKGKRGKVVLRNGQNNKICNVRAKSTT